MELDDPEYLQAVAQEKARNEEFIDLVEKLAKVAPHLWHYFDGQGGFVFSKIFESLKEVGLNFDRRSITNAAHFAEIPDFYLRNPKTYTKKVITDNLRLKVFAKDLYKCRHCGTSENLSVDHIIPESKGGTLDLDNLQTLCRPCNSRKGAKLPT